jgi:transcriptional regulator NrdR family protein
MTKQQAIDTINASFPSIWSKDDVLQLINKIDEGTASFDKDKLMDKIHDAIENAINGMSNDEILDTSECEFEIRNGNEIEIDSIGINTDDIVNAVMDNVADAIDEFVEELEEVKED